MDIMYMAELFVIGWAAALSTLGFVGVAKYIWHIISTSTEESLIEAKILNILNRKGGGS